MQSIQNKLSFKQDQIAAFVAACILVMFISLMVLCMSCESGNKVTALTEEKIERTVTAPEEGIESFEWEDESGVVHEGMIYSTNHTFGNEAVESILSNFHAAPFVLMLEDQGFSVALNRCKFFSTQVEHEFRTYNVFMTLVIFEQSVTVGQSLACLRYTRIQGIAESMQLEKHYIGIDPWICWEESEDAYEQPIGILADGIWWGQSFRPWKRSFIQRPFMSPSTPIEWDWLAWALCTAEGTAAGCAAGAVACAIFAPLDDECAGDACTEAAVGSAIHCATQQLFGG